MSGTSFPSHLIFDGNGNVILNRDNNFSTEGIDTQTYTFDSTGAMTIQILVTGVGQPSMKVNTSYAGRTQGSISVVPEFPVNPMVIAAIGLIGAIVTLRLRHSSALLCVFTE